MPLQGSTYEDFSPLLEKTARFPLWFCQWCGLEAGRGKTYCPECENEYVQLHDAEVSNYN